MHPPNPARQVALVGKAGAGGDLCEAQLPVAHQLDCPPQSQMYNIAVRRQADGLGEQSGEVERAARRYSGEGGNLDGLVEVRNDILLDALERLAAQPAARPDRQRRHMASSQLVDETARYFIPEERPVQVIVGALECQGAGEREK
jgi:hypothetical protein